MAGKREGGGPKFLAMLGPVLKAVRDLGGSARPQEVYEHVAEVLGLDDAAMAEQTSSGVPRYQNRMAWARFYLVRAGLLDSSKRGVWSLTEKGQSTPDLTIEQAKDVFRAAREDLARQSKEADIGKSNTVSDEGVAPELVDTNGTPGDHRIRVLQVLQALAPSAFERFCQRLLREAGFQNVVVTGRSGDGGIDGMGILQVNTLVSFKVLFQCKRYKDTVTPSMVRDFRGAMMGRADKGIILTTGGFTVEAKKEAVRDGVPPIELVDGEKLVNMLEEYEIGLAPVRAFRVDEAFFVSFANVLGEDSAGAN